MAFHIEQGGHDEVHAMRAAVESEAWRFILVVLAATAAWVFFQRHKSFSFLAHAMYFPAIAAVFTELLSGVAPSELFWRSLLGAQQTVLADLCVNTSAYGQGGVRCVFTTPWDPAPIIVPPLLSRLGASEPGNTGGQYPIKPWPGSTLARLPAEPLVIRAVGATTLGALIVVAIVLTCVAMALLLSLGHGAPSVPLRTGQSARGGSPRTPCRWCPRPFGASWSLFCAFCRAAGEELGWRVYLLPRLVQVYEPAIALLLSGIVWGGYHIPIMVLLGTRQHLSYKAVVFSAGMQCASCIFFAYAVGYVSVLGGFGLVPPAFMHFLWNRINPFMLGSVYSKSRGAIVGEPSVINGEGFIGCLVCCASAVAVVVALRPLIAAP